MPHLFPKRDIWIWHTYKIFDINIFTNTQDFTGAGLARAIGYENANVYEILVA